MPDRKPPKFRTWVDGVTLKPDVSPFVEIEPQPYATFEEIPIPVRVLIVQAALLRAVPNDRLSDLYMIPEEWVQRMIDEGSPSDLEDIQFGATVPLGTTEH